MASTPSSIAETPPRTTSSRRPSFSSHVSSNPPDAAPSVTSSSTSDTPCTRLVCICISDTHNTHRAQPPSPRKRQFSSTQVISASLAQRMNSTTSLPDSTLNPHLHGVTMTSRSALPQDAYTVRSDIPLSLTHRHTRPSLFAHLDGRGQVRMLCAAHCIMARPSAVARVRAHPRWRGGLGVRSELAVGTS
ncbi:hypothetical protein BC827DRAFT_635414 [Russula dissimulans]|nr:hypothetical protein BC827DRAFT_635414 [Russula dissimulans]